MRRFFGTIMLYALAFIGFGWAYQNNENVRLTANRIAYVAQADFQQLKSRVTGQKTTTTAKTKAQQQTTGDDDSVSGRWKKAMATVYVNYENQTLQQAALDAITNWNATGCFKFKQTSNKKNADIVMTTMDKDNDAAGLTQMSVDSLTGYFVHGTVYLNTAYLLNSSYGYSMERIINTAEHELGHAMGLQHTNDVSVMQPAGSLYTIQQRDIDNVNELYSSQVNSSSSSASNIKVYRLKTPPINKRLGIKPQNRKMAEDCVTQNADLQPFLLLKLFYLVGKISFFPTSFFYTNRQQIAARIAGSICMAQTFLPTVSPP
ncbi:M57 family metalloprotease [Limosilactobacillus mucosae]|uniref:M57 family metalloprotease n=1 Tax=Limosilactobacillus mucosae TaxID=97478 RepID=UPI000887E0F7|nr:M57 family metalloprotease [Limosilactobacillus mucosae]SDN89201.1 Matrixin [Limosilactobacillus mucosae]SEK36373.1 Matrixin [Limosilactobacillus mucosae]SFK43162.1 Matrixin [Limosilactobacillus mucosae]